MSEQKPLRVAIIGAGPGGLVLAQILHKDPRFSVTVYERGTRGGSDTSTLVGYRILVPPSVLDSLRDQLPAACVALIDGAVGVPQSQGNRVGLMDEKCGLICRMDVQQSRDMCSISRWRLREALLHGAEEFVKFGKQFSSYEEVKGEEGGVRVRFGDGDEIECDVLVGADGAGSKVRKQLLPSSSRTASGLTVIYFKAPFTPETEAMIPWKSGCVVRFRHDPKTVDVITNSHPGNDAPSLNGGGVLQRSPETLRTLRPAEHRPCGLIPHVRNGLLYR